MIDASLGSCLQYMCYSLGAMVSLSMLQILTNSSRITSRLGLRVLELLLSVAILGLVLAPRGSGG